MLEYTLICTVTDTLTGQRLTNEYQSMAHLVQVCQVNAKVDGFLHGRTIAPSGEFDIANPDNAVWTWIFADTGEPAYVIEIERRVVAPPKYDLEPGHRATMYHAGTDQYYDAVVIRTATEDEVSGPPTPDDTW